MINKGLYKTYADSIAKLFCDASGGSGLLCKMSVKARLINKLNDNSFENSFLPNLGQGRFYVHHFSNLKKISNTKWRIDTTFYDLITNERVAGTWLFDTPPNEPKAALKSLLLSFGFNIIQGVFPYTDETLYDERIMHKPSKSPGYGIVFVPHSAGSGGGGNIQPMPEPIPIPPQQVPAETPGLDVAGIFENPLLLIGGAALMFFYLMRN